VLSVLDLARYRAQQGDGFELWALAHLAASPGARAMRRGQIIQIRTIVPRRLEDSRCHWFTQDGRCEVHVNAPFGCAFFDCTMTKEEGDQRSNPAHAAILEDWLAEGPYSQTWQMLHEAGRTVEGSTAARERMRREGRW